MSRSAEAMIMHQHNGQVGGMRKKERNGCDGQLPTAKAQASKPELSMSKKFQTKNRSVAILVSHLFLFASNGNEPAI
jgi:hypothetical protein